MSTRKYVRAHIRRYGASQPRTRGEATAIMWDVRQAEQYLMQLADDPENRKGARRFFAGPTGGGYLFRALPGRGGGG